MRKARERAELFFVIFARNVGSLELLGEFPGARTSSPSATRRCSRSPGTRWRFSPGPGARASTRSSTSSCSRASPRCSPVCRARTTASAFTGSTRRASIAARCSPTASPTIRISTSPRISSRWSSAVRRGPQVPYTKTVIGDDQLAVAIPPASAQARDSMLARIRAETPFDPAAPAPGAGQSQCERNAAASPLDGGSLCGLIRRILAERDDVVSRSRARPPNVARPSSSRRPAARAVSRSPARPRSPSCRRSTPMRP